MSEWQPIETAPEAERIWVAGWQRRSASVAGYWWWHEDAVFDGKAFSHPEATLWAPIVLPKFPAPPQETQS